MLHQTFALSDLPTVLTLVFLEGLLSADNALVLAILVQQLPKHQQKQGLLYGLVGAFVLRAISIVVASTLMRYWWIEAGGAAYLLYLALRHFAHKATAHPDKPRPVRGFWSTIVIVELTDLAFAIDSILAAVALVGPAPVRSEAHPKLWVIYLGGILGVVMMRFVANFFLTLLNRFARLETSAYLIIAWISVKLGVSSYAHFVEVVLKGHPSIEHLPAWLFWGVMLALFLYGFRRLPAYLMGLWVAAWGAAIVLGWAGVGESVAEGLRAYGWAFWIGLAGAFGLGMLKPEPPASPPDAESA